MTTPKVRDLAVRLVKGLGYDQFEAKDGVAALAVLNSGRHVDLLFADIVMSGMIGFELWRQARLRLPSLKAVFVSGYSDDLISDWPENQERPVVLRKPLLAEVAERRIKSTV